MANKTTLPNRFGFKKRDPAQLESLRLSAERAGRIADALQARLPGARDDVDRHRRFAETGR